MFELQTLELFVAASVLFAVFPGPAVFYIVTRSIAQGRGAGIVSALGIETGNLVHVAAATAGLSALLASSALAEARPRRFAGFAAPPRPPASMPKGFMPRGFVLDPA
jgi:threonine/homoserine/homoserine lactone efflux protein